MSVTEISPPGDDGFERTPPHDIAAEQCALGGMLLSAEAIEDVVLVIGPADHYRPAHTMIHEAILELWESGEPVDAVTVKDLLAKRGELARAGGAPYLHTLIASVPTAANAAHYARFVAQHAASRRAIESGTRLVQAGYEPAKETADLVDQAYTAADYIAGTGTGDGPQPIGEVFVSTVVSLEEKRARGLALPWRDLHDLLNGLPDGDLNVIGARPAIGKSVAALNMAAYAAIHEGVPSVLFTMEMSREEIMLRLIAAEARVSMHALTRRDLTSDDMDRIAKAHPKIADAPLTIDDTSDCSIGHMWSTVRSMSRKPETKPGLVVVDYIQLMREPPRADNRQLAVGANARGLKNLAGEFGLPVVALSQLNRKADTRQDRRPEMSDLRESGEIESHAAVVILLHREDAYDRESPRAGEIDLIVAKNRNGPNATITAAFQGHYARIMDMAPERPLERREVSDLDARRRLK